MKLMWDDILTSVPESILVIGIDIDSGRKGRNSSLAPQKQKINISISTGSIWLRIDRNGYTEFI